MGLSISWVAVHGEGNEVVWRELGLAPTGERDEFVAESPIAGARLEKDWCLVTFNRYEHELVHDEVLKRLSKGCTLVAAGAEEHVMCSFAVEWRDGARTWWISHDPQEGIETLEAEGSLPEGFDGLRRELLAQQNAAGGSEADVDYVFSIPLDTAKLVTGFSHEENEPDDGFAVLARAKDE
jgi:hypothetical protein